MPLVKDEGAKPKIKRKTVNIPNFELKKGDQVFLGVDSDGNTRLVPWDVHCRSFKGIDYSFQGTDPTNLGNNRIVHDPMDSYATFGLTNSKTNSGYPSLTVSFTHHIPGTDAIFIFSGDDTATGNYGGNNVQCCIFNLVSTETLEYEIDNLNVYNSTTDGRALQAFYMGDDATYWYYLVSYTTGLDLRFRSKLVRVTKTNFAMGVSNEATKVLQLADCASIFRIDTSANRVYFHEPHRGDYFHYYDYDLTAFTLTGITTTTRAATVEAWGLPSYEQGNSLGTDHHALTADPDDFTKTYAFFDTENGTFSENSFEKTVYKIYELIHDGTKWAVSAINEGENTFDYFTSNFVSWLGLGGGYFCNRYSAFNGETQRMFFHIDSATKQITFPYKASEHYFANYAIDKLAEDDWIDLSNTSSAPRGNYINGTYYSLGEAIIDGKVRPGFDIRYLMSIIPPYPSATVNRKTYGALPASTVNRPAAYVLKEDADFVYGVLVGSYTGAGGNTYLSSSAFRIPRGCPQISSKPIARAASNSVKGAFGMNVLRFSANPSDGDTVTIGSVTYTFKTALTPTAGEVLIGADSERSAENLQRAINQRTGEGSSWAAGTTLNTEVCVVDESEAATMNGERYVYLRTIYKTGDVISCSETGANMAFDHATMQNGAPGGDVVLDIYEGVEYAEGTPDTYQTYDNETYELRYLNGHFDMSHCEIAGWNTHSIRFSGATTPDSSDTSFREFNGPVVVDNLQVVSSGNPLATENNYVKARGRRLCYVPYNGTAVSMHALFKVGILK
jgi:hypothetical protein